MILQLPNQKSAVTKYSARYVASFLINMPAEKIDLYKWITEITDEDYKSFSKSHKAMGSFFKDGVFYAINVENIGNETLIQNYEMKYHSPNHIQFYSPKTKAYIMRWFPAVVGVPWEMEIRPLTSTTSEFSCLIGVDFPNRILEVAAWLNGLGGTFLKNHLKEEGKSFARDIERKFKSLT